MSPRMKERPDNTESIVACIVEAVADERGVGPMDLTPLYNTIDSTTLQPLVDSGSVDAVSFTYEGFAVMVSGDGRVDLEAVGE